ncbi:21688_t:CDS:1, partial [Gigaspora margarita]
DIIQVRTPSGWSYDEPLVRSNISDGFHRVKASSGYFYDDPLVRALSSKGSSGCSCDDPL